MMVILFRLFRWGVVTLCMSSVSLFGQEALDDKPLVPSVPANPMPVEEKEEWPPSGMKMFTPGLKLGNIGDNPKKSYRRVFQRTLMPTEEKHWWNAVITFDDQLIPFSKEEASAREVMADLAPRGVRALFFANVPGVASPTLRPLLRMKNAEERAEACREILEERRAQFVEEIRFLLRMKKEGVWLCDVHNHTAFHQNMRSFKEGSARMQLCVQGIRFVEECLAEAYEAERPGVARSRWFRFPFLAVPRDSKARAAINDLFTELGYLSSGETQDSKDYANRSPKQAYNSLRAAFEGKRYNPKLGPYSTAQHPTALFHTKTWRDIRSGVLQALDEAKTATKAVPNIN